MENFNEQRRAGGMPVFYGARYQKGMGVGSMFKSFFRWILPVAKTHVLPVLKDAAQFVGTEAVKTATSIATDAIEGKDLNSSVKERAKETLGNLSEKTQSIIQQQKGGHSEDIKAFIKRKNKIKTKIKSKKVKFNDAFSE